MLENVNTPPGQGSRGGAGTASAGTDRTQTLGHSRRTRLADAALAYAERGWRIVPVPPGEKTPRLKGWPDRATAEPEQVARWFARSPNLNLALATGAGSRVVVVDVDGPEGRASWRDLQDAYCDAPATLTCRSPRTDGGTHLYFRHPGGTVRNSTSKLGPGIDVRGDRGACVLPPSWRREGRYRWVDPDVPVADPPAWLVALLQPPPEATPARPIVPANPTRRLVALRDTVAGAVEGNRNAVLNWAAFVLRDDVQGGRVDLEDAWSTLANAGLAAGLPLTEVRRTLASGFGPEVRP
jgi:hypothetical protein